MSKVANKFLFGMILVIGLIFTPVSHGQAAPDNVCAPPCNPGGGGGGTLPPPPKAPSSLSLAVVQTLQSKMLTVSNKLDSGQQPTSSDYAAAATAAQAYFANSDETGWTSTLQS